MATIYYEKDTDPGVLSDQKIAVLGFGSQGHAHAQNLQDSGFDVRVGLRAGSRSRTAAESAGLRVLDTADAVAEAVAEADVVMCLLPDTSHKAVYASDIAPNLKDGDMLMFAHGFSIHFGTVVPPADVDVTMIAPKGPGHLVRRTYTEGIGTPAIVAVQQDATGKALQRALAYGAAIGCAKPGIIETTFKEETETDLFGEQAVLCGGATKLVQAGWETLVEAGYQPEVAYYECLHELKLIVDLFYEGGITRMHEFISETAQYGALTRGDYIVDANTRAQMKKVLTEIQDGTFARQWIAEYAAGNANYKAMKQADLDHPIEAVGKKLRANMKWLSTAPQAAKPAAAAQTEAA